MGQSCGGGEERFLRSKGALYREQLSVAGMVIRKTICIMKAPRMGDPVGYKDGPQWPSMSGIRPHCRDSCLYWEREKGLQNNESQK